MMKRGYEIFDGDGAVIRITDEKDVAYLEMAGSAARDCWIVGHRLNRELLLDLRDAIDEILQHWFCDKEPSPQELYRKYLSTTETSLSPEQIKSRREAARRLMRRKQERGMDCTTFIPIEVEHEDFSSSSVQNDMDYLDKLRRET